MSIQSEIARLRTNVSNSFAAVAEKGGTVEAGANSDDLAAAILTIPSGGAVTTMPEFTYSVANGYQTDVDPVTGTWIIRLLTSGKLKFTSAPPPIDVFVVGGGGGTSGHDGTGVPSGGGGYTETTFGYQPVINQEYTITVGSGGSAGNATGDGGRGGTSSAFNASAGGGDGGEYESGQGGNGGSGGNGFNSNAAGATDGNDGVDGTGGYPGGEGQGTTTREFGEPDGILYASGGATNSSGKAGADNTGNGGGKPRNSAAGKGNAGGSGIVVIRGAVQ